MNNDNYGIMLESFVSTSFLQVAQVYWKSIRAWPFGSYKKVR